MAPVEKNSKVIYPDPDDSDLKDLPATTEEVHGNIKTRTEYDYDDDDKMIKIVSQFRIEKRRVSKTVAQRKNLPKYGLSKEDKPGPNTATTITSEEITMQFLTNKIEEEDENEDVKKKLIDSAKGQVKCRLCKEDHWTTMCPYKDQLDPLRSSLMGEEKEEDGGGADAGANKGMGGGVAAGKYVPPSMREGANRRGDAMSSRNRGDEPTVRVTNLSENTRETDLQNLFQQFGEIARIYLAKDKNTGCSKGFAYINFKRKDEAETAINKLNGHGYDHLILSVEWAKPSGTVN